MTPGTARKSSSGSSAAKVAGVTTVGLLTLLLNPFFLGSVLAVAALVSGAKSRRE